MCGVCVNGDRLCVRARLSMRELARMCAECICVHVHVCALVFPYVIA